MDINLNIHYKNVCFNSKFNINSMIGDILESSMSYHRLIVYDIYGIYLKKDDNIVEYIGTDDFPFHLKISRLISEYGNIESLYITDKDSKSLDNISERIRANYITYLGVKEDENIISMYSNRQQRYQIPGSMLNSTNNIQYMIPINYGNVNQNVTYLNNMPNGGLVTPSIGVDGLNEEVNILDENDENNEIENIMGEVGEDGIDEIDYEQGESNSEIEQSNHLSAQPAPPAQPALQNNLINNNMIYEYIYNIPINPIQLNNLPFNTMQNPINQENNEENYQPGQIGNNVNHYFNNLMNTLFGSNYMAIIQRLNQIRQNHEQIPSTEEEYDEFLESLNIEPNANILDFLHELATWLRNMQMEDVAIVTDDKEIDNLICGKYKSIKETHEMDMDSCGITLDEFEDESDVVILPCKHAFIKDSIFKWLKDHSNKCPICRVEIGKGVPKLD